MKSPGGMIEWTCPHCGSAAIELIYWLMGQKSGGCNGCLTWWPWRQRIKRRTEQHDEQA